MPEKKQKTSQVINVGKLMKKEAYHQSGKRKKIKQYRVSKDAIREEISFINALIENHIASICERFSHTKRQIILAEDIIQENGFKKEIIKEE